MSFAACKIVTLSFKLVDKSLKLRLRILKGEPVVSVEGAAGGVEGGEAGRKRAGVTEGDKSKKQRRDEEKMQAAAAAAAAAVTSAATIVVDMSYDDLMTDKECASLATQVLSH